MKKALVLFVFSMTVVFFGAPPTYAVTEYDCGCNPYDQPSSGIEESYECSCSNDNTLGKFETKNYNVKCTIDESVVGDVTPENCVTGRKSSTTCTIQSDVNDGAQRGCTNWSLTDDGLKITGYCQQYSHSCDHDVGDSDKYCHCGL